MSQLAPVLRRLVRRPSFAVLAAATLAVGLGATAAIFAVVDAVLLRPLGYPQAERLVAVEHAAPGLDLPRLQISERLFLHYRDNVESFERLGLYDRRPASVSGLERPVEVRATFLTPSVLELLRARPTLGRLFTQEEGQPGASPTAILSDGFWRRHLGADPEVLGRLLTVDGVAVEIVGVMPADFSFPVAGGELWVAHAVDPATASLGSFGFAALGRLKPGVSLELADAEIRQVLGDVGVTFADAPSSAVLARSGFEVALRPYRDVVAGGVGPVLWLIFATAGFVLLVAAVNVTSLVLARAERRSREMAIRGALGAGRRSLASASLAEGLVVATAAGALGLLVGNLALRALLRLAPEGLPRMEAVAFDGRTVLAVGCLSMLCGLVFGLVPMLRIGSRELAVTLRSGGRSSGGRRRHRARRLLVATQIAISTLLLVGAGLLARSFLELTRLDPGFETRGAFSFRLSLPPSTIQHDYEAARFYQRLLDQLAALPGVQEAVSTGSVPMSRRNSASGHRSREALERGEAATPTVFSVQHISPGYFAALGIPLLEGRALERTDFENRTGKVVVSQAVARTLWPGESAVGKQVFPGRPSDEEGWLEVVGVVGDVLGGDPRQGEEPTVYYPWMNPVEDMWVARQQAVVLRADGDSAALMEAVRRVVWSLDPDLPLAEIRSLEEVVSASRARLAFTALMLILAAAVALLLGAIGTYGVLSYLVAQRTREIGIRLAHGARSGDILGLVTREGLGLAAAGGTVGLVAAALLSGTLEAVLFAVEPLDPSTYLLAPLILTVAVLLACLVPARRASAVDPVVALRNE